MDGFDALQDSALPDCAAMPKTLLTPGRGVSSTGPAPTTRAMIHAALTCRWETVRCCARWMTVR
jgi:hypothetical protein